MSNKQKKFLSRTTWTVGCFAVMLFTSASLYGWKTAILAVIGVVALGLFLRGGYQLLQARMAKH
jgi:small-conductance mechanosensitive channel